MADTKISTLTELTDPAIGDEFVIVDKSDTSMAASGTDKRIKYQALDQAIAKAMCKTPPTGVTYQNFDRYSAANGTATPTSGTMRLSGIWLPAGIVVTSISFLSIGALTAGTSPHLWVALYDSSCNLLRQSADDTSPTWAANTLKTFSLASTFTTTYTGLHYVGLLVAQSGGTMVTLAGTGVGNAALVNLDPVMAGNSNTGLTTTAPDPASAPGTGLTNLYWFGVA